MTLSPLQKWAQEQIDSHELLWEEQKDIRAECKEIRQSLWAMREHLSKDQAIWVKSHGRRQD